MMKNLMFLLLCWPGVAALVLVFFKALRRQWFPAGLLFESIPERCSIHLA